MWTAEEEKLTNAIKDNGPKKLAYAKVLQLAEVCYEFCRQNCTIYFYLIMFFLAENIATIMSTPFYRTLVGPMRRFVERSGESASI